MKIKIGDTVICEISDGNMAVLKNSIPESDIFSHLKMEVGMEYQRQPF